MRVVRTRVLPLPAPREDERGFARQGDGLVLLGVEVYRESGASTRKVVSGTTFPTDQTIDFPGKTRL
jgi:hypothetical protein